MKLLKIIYSKYFSFVIWFFILINLFAIFYINRNKLYEGNDDNINLKKPTPPTEKIIGLADSVSGNSN